MNRRRFRFPALVAALLIPTMLLNSAVPDAEDLSSALRPAGTVLRGAASLFAASATSAKRVNAAQAGPRKRPSPDVPLPKTHGTRRYRTSLDVLRTGSDLLGRVTLGASIGTLAASVGEPWFIARDQSRSFWTYDVLNGNAWLVVTVSNGTIAAAQVMAKNGRSAMVRDSHGVALGDPAAPLGGMAGAHRDVYRFSDAGSLVVSVSDGSSARLYGSDRSGAVDRVGKTNGPTELPSFIRWFTNSGFSPDRAIPFSAYRAIGEDAYISRVDLRSLSCPSSDGWHRLSSKAITYAGAPMDRVDVQCAHTAYRRALYFATTASDLQPLSIDERAKSEYRAALASRPGGSAAMRAAPVIAAAPAVGLIWFQTPSGRCGQGCTDALFQYVDDPQHPFTSIHVYKAAVAEDGTVYTNGAVQGAAVRSSAATRPISAAGLPPSEYCVWGSGYGKCDFIAPDGQHCYIGIATSGTGTTSFGPICLMGTGDPADGPHGPHCDGASGATGNPVDVVSGRLWQQADDASLSGPFGVTFMHRYDSSRAAAAADIGYGWGHAYSASLDVSNVGNGVATYHASDCSRSYLNSFGPGTASYTSFDSYTGNTLTTRVDGTYVLTTWDNRTSTFDSSGRLTAIADRIGNAQTVNRDAQHRISSVVDGLSRSLTFAYDAQSRISSVSSSPAGVSIQMSYDTGTNCYSGDLCSVTESDGAVWSYQYYNPASNGGNHLLEYVRDPLNNVAEYNQYQLINLGSGDNHYRVVHQEQDSGKNARTYAYSQSSSQSAQTVVSDSLGTSHQTTYSWNGLEQQVVTVSGPLCGCDGDQLAIGTDTYNRPQSVNEGATGTQTMSFAYTRDVNFTSPDGLTTYTVLAYPGASAFTTYGVQTTAGPKNVNRTVGYYALGDARQDLIHTVTEPSVNHAASSAVTTIAYSTQGLPTTATRTGYAHGVPTTYSVSFVYDTRGRLTSITGPRTDVTQQTSWSYFSDSDADLARRGQAQSITNALGHAIAFAGGASPYNTYTIYGRPKSATDQNGVQWNYGFDARGRLTSNVLVATGATTQFQYDALGRRTQTTKPLGNATRFSFDADGNAAGALRLDAGGNQHEQAVYAYDAMSRLSAVTYQGCAVPATTCTSWGTTFNIALGFTGLDQLSSLTSPDGGVASYSYDQYGNPRTVTSGSGAAVASAASQFGQNHESLSNSFGKTGSVSLSYRYDTQGNASLITPAGSAASTAEYFDDFGRLEKSVAPYTGTSIYQFDAAGNATSATDGNGAVTTMAYDALNRRTSAVSSRSGLPTESVYWTYDVSGSGNYGIGRVSSMTDPSGSTSYTYDQRGHLASTVQTVATMPYATAYTYDANGNRQTITLPSGRVLTYAYDFADRPLSVASGTTTYVGSASYEPFGPIAQVNFGNGTSQTRSYTQRYAPLENKVTSGATTLVDQTYTVNPAGFITGVGDALNSGYSRTYSYGGLSSYLLAQVNTGPALWGVGTFSDTFNENLAAARLPNTDARGFKYNRNQQLTSVFNLGTGVSSSVSHDAAGNQTAFQSATYTYSTRNHLASGDAVSYVYDGWGRRVSATASAGTRTSLYDPDMHLQSETSLSSGAIAYDYIWFAGIPVAQEDVGAQTHWTVTDHLGTPFLQTTSSGTAYWQADYEPNGAVYSLRTADAHQPLRLPGQEAEQFAVGSPNGATPRLYNGFRWYEPRFMRYTQADPLGYAAGSFNLYSYAANNPLNYSDSLGLAFGEDDAAAAAVGAAIGLGTQLAGDLATGHQSSASDYAVAAATGAIAGVIGWNTAGLGLIGALLTGASAGAISSLLSQALALATGQQCQFDIGNLALNAGIGAATAGLGRGIGRALHPSLPPKLARAIPPEYENPATMGPPGQLDAFVTVPEDIAGMNASQIAARLGLDASPTGFNVYIFDTPATGLASPILRSNPRFVGGGYTSGGAREFVVPNLPFPPGTTVRLVK